jgi:AraC family transcriptional regulator
VARSSSWEPIFLDTGRSPLGRVLSNALRAASKVRGFGTILFSQSKLRRNPGKRQLAQFRLVPPLGIDGEGGRREMRDRQLVNGHYYGELVKRCDVAGLILTETFYSAGALVPNHSHASAYFCVVLQGAYCETYGRRNRECNAMTVAFHPAEEIHSERFRNEEVRSFNVEVGSECMKRIWEHSVVLDGPSDFHGGSISRLGLKLYREFVRGDDVSPLAMEGLVLEIVAAGSRLGRKKTVDARPARWLERARELLHAQFAKTLTTAQIAVAVGVHPVHLAREFRRHYRLTIGEYACRLRVDFACEHSVAHDSPLAEVAMLAGFFDQSHFPRTFKALTGLTPGEYRAAAGLPAACAVNQRDCRVE